MSNNLLVSVNITTYNRANLLQRCLDSIISQSYKNLEINVVDDGSIDATEKVVLQYIKKDKRIKYYKHKKNKGNAHARNTALANCNGYYIAFMDDDDEWIDKDKIKKQIDIFENDKSGKLAVICTSVNLIDDNNNIKPKIILKPHDLKYRILCGNSMIYSPTVMTKKSIMKEIGGFDERLPRGVDSDYYRTCIVKYGYDVHFMEDITTNIYEYGNDRMTNQFSIKSNNDIITANFYLIKKYVFFYCIYPLAFFKRMKNIMIAMVKLVLIKVGLRK